MGAIKQFMLMLWKGYIQRIRQWPLFLMEFVAPIILMVIVVIVRQASKPDDTGDCFYAPRTMPSSGIRFAQDMACGMDNKCFRSEEEALRYRTEGVASIFGTLSDLNTPGTVEALLSLERTNEVLNKLVETLNSEEVQALLNFEPRVGNLFANETEVLYFLVDGEYLSPDVARTLLNATFNFTTAIELIGDYDIRSAVCDPERLGSFLVFPAEGATAEDVSQELCAVNETLVPSIVDTLLNQLNVTAIFDLVHDLSLATGDYGLAHLIEDIARLLEAGDTLQTSQLLLGNLELFSKMADVLRLFAGVTDPTQLADFALIGRVLEEVSRQLPDDSVLGEVNRGIQVARTIMGWFNTRQYDFSSITLGSFLPDGMSPEQISPMFASLQLSEEELQIFLNANLSVQRAIQYNNVLQAGSTPQMALCVMPSFFTVLFVIPANGSEQLQQVLNVTAVRMCELEADDPFILFLANGFSIETLMQQIQSNLQSDVVDVDWTTILYDTTTFVSNMLTDLEPLFAWFKNGGGFQNAWQSLMGLAGQVNTDHQSLQGILSIFVRTLQSLQLETFDEFRVASYVYKLCLDIMELGIQQQQGIMDGLAHLMRQGAILRDLDFDPSIALPIYVDVLTTLITQDQITDVTVVCNVAELSALVPSANPEILSDVVSVLCTEESIANVQQLMAIIQSQELNATITEITKVINGQIPLLYFPTYYAPELYQRTIQVFSQLNQLPTLNEAWVADVMESWGLDAQESLNLVLASFQSFYGNTTTQEIKASLSATLESLAQEPELEQTVTAIRALMGIINNVITWTYPATFPYLKSGQWQKFEQLVRSTLPMLESVLMNLDPATRSMLDYTAHMYSLVLNVVEQQTVFNNDVILTVERLMMALEEGIQDEARVNVTLQLITQLLSPGAIQAIADSSDPASILCSATQLQTLLPTLTSDDISDLVGALCSYDINMILQEMFVLLQQEPLQAAVDELSRALEGDVMNIEPYNVTALYIRSWNVFTAMFEDNLRRTPEAWASVFNIDSERSTTVIIDLLLQLLNVSTDSSVTQLVELLNGLTADESLRRPLLASAAVIQWLTDNQAVIFDARQWTLGSFVEGENLAEQLNSALELNAEVMAALVTSPIASERLQVYITALMSSNGSLCLEPGFDYIFEGSVSPEVQVTLENIQASLCDMSQVDDTFSTLFIDLMLKLGEAERAAMADWEQVLNSLTSLLTSLATLDTIPLGRLLQDLYTTLDISRALELFTSSISMNPDENLRQLSRLSSFTMLHPSLQVVAVYAHALSGILDMVDLSRESILGLSDSATTVVENNPAFASLLEDLIARHPQEAPVVLAKLLNPAVLQTLLTSDNFGVNYLCDASALAHLLQVDSDVINMAAISQLLCERSADLISGLQMIAQGFDIQALENKLNEVLALIAGDAAIPEPADYEALLNRTMSLWPMLTELPQELIESWGSLQGVLDTSLTSEQWWMFQQVLSGVYVNETSAYLVDYFGEQVENTTYWLRVAPIVKFHTTIAFQIIDETQYIQALLDGATGQVTHVLLTQLPAILETLVPLVQNQQQFSAFLQENEGNVLMTFCDPSLGPQYLTPVNDLDIMAVYQAVCREDLLGEIQMEIVDVIQEAYLPLDEALSHLSGRRGDTFDKDIDWAGLYTGVLETVNIATLWYGDESPWLRLLAEVATLDVARIQMAMMELVNGFMQAANSGMELGSFSTQLDQVYSLLEQSLGPQQTGELWNTLSLAAYTYETYLDLVLQLMQIVGEDGLQLSALLGDSEMLNRLLGNVSELTLEVQVALDRATVNVQKLVELLMVPTSELVGLQLCRDVQLSELLTVADPSSLATLEQMLCGLDLQALLEEISRVPLVADVLATVQMVSTGFDQIQLPENYMLDIDRLVAKQQLLIQLFGGSHLESVIGQLQELLNQLLAAVSGMDMQQQGGVGENEEIMAILQQLGQIMGLDFSSTESLLAGLRQYIPSGLPGQLRVADAILHKMNGVLESLKGATSVEESLSEFPETTKLAQLLMDRPEILAVLAFSLSKMEFQSLLTLEPMEAILAFCDVNNDVTQLLAYPPGFEMSDLEKAARLNEMKVRFCGVDLGSLLANELYLDEAQLMALLSNTAPLIEAEAMLLFDKAVTTGELLVEVFSSFADSMFGGFGNMTGNWEESLATLSQSLLQALQGDSGDMLQRFLEMFDLSALMDISEEDIQQLIYNLTSGYTGILSELSNQLTELRTMPNVTLYSLIPEEFWAQVRSYVDESVIAELQKPIPDVIASMMMFFNETYSDFDCANLLTMAELPEYSEFICSLTEGDLSQLQDILMDEFALAQMATLLEFVNNQSMPLNTSWAVDYLTNLTAHVQSWLATIDLYDMTSDLNAGQLQEFVLSILGTVNKTYVMETVQVLTELLSTVADTELMSGIEPYLNLSESLAGLVANFSRLVEDQRPLQAVNISMLFGGEEVWRSLLTNTLSLPQSWVEQLMSANISLQDLHNLTMQAAHVNTSTVLHDLVCSADNLTSLLSLPVNANVQELSAQLCAQDLNSLVDMFNDNFDWMQFVAYAENLQLNVSASAAEALMSQLFEAVRQLPGINPGDVVCLEVYVNSFPSSGNLSAMGSWLSEIVSSLFYQLSLSDSYESEAMQQAVTNLADAFAALLRPEELGLNTTQLACWISNTTALRDSLTPDLTDQAFALLLNFPLTTTDVSRLDAELSALPQTICAGLNEAVAFMNTSDALAIHEIVGQFIDTSQQLGAEEVVRQLAQLMCGLDLSDLTEAVQQLLNFSHVLDQLLNNKCLSLPGGAWDQFVETRDIVNQTLTELWALTLNATMTNATQFSIEALQQAFMDILAAIQENAYEEQIIQLILSVVPGFEPTEEDRALLGTLSMVLQEVIMTQDVTPIMTLISDGMFIEGLTRFLARLSEQLGDTTLSTLFEELYMWLDGFHAYTGTDLLDPTEWQAFIAVVTQVSHGDGNNTGYLTDVCTRSLGFMDAAAYEGRLLPLLAMGQPYLHTTSSILGMLPTLYNASCHVNSSSLVDWIGLLNVNEIITQIMALTEPDVQQFDCGVYIENIVTLSHLASDWPTAVAGPTQAITCLINSASQSIPALQELDNMVIFLSDLDIALRDLPGLGDLGGLIPLLNMTLQAAFQQDPLYVQLTDILVSEDGVRQLLENYLGLPVEQLNQLLASNISLTGLLSLDEAELAALLCDPEALGRVLDMPVNSDLDLTLLTADLCEGGQVEEFIAAFRPLIDFGAVVLELTENVPTASLNTTWLSGFIDDINTLINNVEQLSALFSTLSNLPELLETNLPGALASIEELLRTGGISLVTKSLNAVLENFKYQVNDPWALAFISDLQTMSNALESLYFFQRGFNARVRDVLDDPAAFERFLIDDLGVDPAAANALINARLSVLELSAMADNIQLEDRFCDPAELGNLITVAEDSPADVAQISSELCRLSTEQLSAMTQFLVDNLDIGDFVANLAALDPGSLSDRLQLDELSRVLDLFAPLGDALDDIQALAQSDNPDESEGLSLTENIAILTSSSDYQSEESLKALGRLVCGRNDSFLLRDAYDITGDDREILTSDSEDENDDGARRRRKRRASCYEQGFSNWQLYECLQMRTQYCADMYTNLQNTTVGQVVWRFIKPFLQGRVYVKPLNSVTRALMEEALSVFDDISSIRDLVQAFSENSHYIRSLSETAGEQADLLEETLNNPILRKYITDGLGQEPEVLIDSIRSLEAVTPESLDGIEFILENLLQASWCVESRSSRIKKYDEGDIINDDKRYTLLAVVEFDGMDCYAEYNPEDNSNDVCTLQQNLETKLPKHIAYTLRMNDDNVPRTSRLKDIYYRPTPEHNFADEHRYFRGFVQVQSMIDGAIIRAQTGCRVEAPKIETNQMPFPCYASDRFLNYVTMYVFPILMVFMWLFAIGMATSRKVADKQMALEETMMTMGLRSGVIWLSWFVGMFLTMSVLSIIIVLLLKYGQVYPHSNTGILILFLLAYSFSTLMLSYMVSAFFTNAVLALLVAIILYCVFYFPFFIVIAVRDTLPLWGEILVNIACNTAFGNAAQIAAAYELRGEGVQWSNIADTDALYLNLSFGYTVLQLTLDGILYAIIGWYVSNVRPGQFGVRRPLCFCFIPKFWGCDCCSGKGGKRYRLQGSNRGGNQNNSDAGEDSPGERDPATLPVGIAFHHLRKHRGKRDVIHDLDVNIFQGQITALLGQNGAGKTTAIQLVTGTTMPTSGRVYVNGKNVITHTAAIRRDLGVCPQQNILFNYMTVWEHLEFYSSLKGKLSESERRQDLKELIVKLGLTEQVFVRADKLSGGQRRRLQVATAFVGGPSVIVLDEPTAGVDSQARRHIWSLIAGLRSPQRTILLCTHHLDEAEILSDRVLVLHQGRLLTKGSPLYLRRQYGSGYRLTIEKQMLEVDEASCSDSYYRSHFNSASVLELLRKHVPEAELMTEQPTDVTYSLPAHRGQQAQFAPLFDELESQQEERSIASVGISDSTLEEVFIKIIKAANDGEKMDAEILRKMPTNAEDELNKKRKESTATEATFVDPETPIREPNMDSNDRSLFFIIVALFYKHALHTVLNWRSYLSFILLPIILVIAAMLCMTYRPESKNEPVIQLAPELYKDSHAFFRSDMSSPFIDKVREDLELQKGMAAACFCLSRSQSRAFRNNTFCDREATCFQKSQFRCNVNGHLFKDAPDANDPVYNKSVNDLPTCTCDKDIIGNGYECPKGSYGRPPREMSYDSGIKLYDLSDNVFSTSDHLRMSFIDYIDNRFGGLEFPASEEEREEFDVRVWYNNKGAHALVAFHSAASNLLLRASLNLTSDAEARQYGISTFNKPLDGVYADFSQETILQKLTDLGIALILLTAFAFVVAGQTVYLVGERVNGEKRLQLIYGVPLLAYWLVALIWQMFLCSIPVFLTVIIMRCFSLDAYLAGPNQMNLWAHTALFILFCWAAVPFTYLVIRICRFVHNAYLSIFLYLFFAGLISCTCLFLLKQTAYVEEIAEAVDVLERIFLVLAPFCLVDASMVITHNEYVWRIKRDYLLQVSDRIYAYDLDEGIGWHLVALAVQGGFFLLLHLMIETALACPSLCKSINRGHRDLDYQEDSDVSLERQRVQTGGATSDTLLLYNVRKSFKRGGQRFVAVNNLSLGVQKGECFGLLGVNGAGKTTTFHAITGEIAPNKGMIRVNGKIVNGSTWRLNGRVGYCPQTYALDDYLTGRAQLRFYCVVKNVNKVNLVVSRLISKFDLTAHADVRINRYSGGTKRKLQAAISVIGNPDLILLDEPTAGIDSLSRRHIWENIREMTNKGKTVVLTSHSVSECEQLCSRMGFLVDGRFKCLGSSQHLKHKFGQGYMVTLRIAGEAADLERAVTFMKTSFTDCYLKAAHLNQLEFSLHNPHSVKLSEVFGRLEANRHSLKISEYSVCQTSLERVFMNLSYTQGDGTAGSDSSQLGGSGLGASTLGASRVGGYNNQTYASGFGDSETPSAPRTSTAYSGRRTLDATRHSLTSIPGYGGSEVAAAKQVNVSFSDDETLKRRSLYSNTSSFVPSNAPSNVPGNGADSEPRPGSSREGSGEGS